jgi:hypothetical protein
MINIESCFDSWFIQVLSPEGDKVLKSYSWGHNDSENGVGGDKKFAELLEYLGHNVNWEERY